MDMTGQRTLKATQQQAWEALNDPEILKACIPGCKKFEATGDNAYAVAAGIKIGPVAATFNGNVQLTDIVAPTSYKLNFDAQGGVAGFGKGESSVELKPLPEGCELNYTVHSTVGGKIAQLGQRLIDGVAKNMAEDFFKRFEAALEERYPPAETPADSGAAAPSPTPASASGMPTWVWAAGAVAVAVVIWLISR
ncbi:carbon monoxide dehydrogenase [Hydrogenophaga crassostreae]|uniref:Carbon monoxide dehydrogenase n=1 Tax=Hydrogenophaga crassostreae TaxID=1763535 RepID=A0A163CGB7_9BURK|nr:carbon monoxide dehydrogenase subunit G [Hydrogenophaga crassostreae]AOW13721.1 carbon monoxide dehydrogenase [Hydrogenophaga crassostreae]OAD42018.1 carbon monoxide dehydrogenase [Hydrogenophaga crassostreae]